MNASRNGEWFNQLAVNIGIYNKDGAEKKHWHELDQFIEYMIPKLDARKWYEPIAYTPHDFTHHVKKVLQNGSDLMSKVVDSFSIDELLVFQYACILHDLEMAYNPYGREIHGALADSILDVFSKDKINKVVKDDFTKIEQDIFDMAYSGDHQTKVRKELIDRVHESLTVIIKDQLPYGNYRKAAGKIILGHSDIKLENGRIDTLNNAFYKEEIKGKEDRRVIKTRIMAAILRLADELDCSKQRKDGLDLAVPTQESEKYWDQLELINDVLIDVPEIRLDINDEEFMKTGKRQQCIELLSKVYDKIEEERETVVRCLHEEKFNLDLGEEVKLLFHDTVLEDEFWQYYNNFKKKKRHVDEEPFEIAELIEYIENRIEDKELLCEVHRNINGQGIRNYLDCNGLLTDPRILHGVSKAFINAIFTDSFEHLPQEITTDEYVLVGVANSGVVLASRIAMETNMPMIYYVPPQKKRDFSKMEKKWKKYASAYRERKAILIIGANVTGYSLTQAKDFLKSTFTDKTPCQIDAILGIVNRDGGSGTLKEMEDSGIRIHFLLDTDKYTVDLCQYSDGSRKCPYHEQCKGGASKNEVN